MLTVFEETIVYWCFICVVISVFIVVFVSAVFVYKGRIKTIFKDNNSKGKITEHRKHFNFANILFFFALNY